MDRFAAARHKVQRANKHIADLGKIVLALPDAYASTVEPDIGGFQRLKYIPPDMSELSVVIALLIGDAVHNLRTALDYAYLGAVEIHAPETLDDHTKFPTGKTRADVEGMLKGRKINSVCPKLFKRIVSDIKPYEIDGNCLIRILHQLDLSDKHFLFIPTMRVVDVRDIIAEDSKGNPVTIVTDLIRENGEFFLPIPPDVKLKDKGKLTVDVVFGSVEDVTINLTENMPVMADLKSLSELTIKVIHILENV